MEIREQLKKDLEKLVEEKGLAWFKGNITLEHPQDPSNGDYSSNIALRARQAPQSEEFGAYATADEIAKKLISDWEKPDYLGKVEIINGFINFWLSEAVLSKELALALEEAERYPSASLRASLKGQKLMVEFAHPNTHKEVHIGHLRNISLGECLCRLFEFSGAKVIRVNYQGDIGLHIAKALYGILKNLKTKKLKDSKLEEKIKFLASAYVEGNSAYNDNPEARSEVEEINKKLYESDPEVTKLWQETREWSLRYFDLIYKRLGTKFDRLYFESEVARSGLDIVRKSLDTVFEKSDGAVIYPGERYGLHNRVFINSLGLPTYEAKDIGLAQLQFSEFNPNKIIHVVGPEQSDYFKVVFSALEKALPASSGKEFHLPYGWVRLKTGKMSSRTGDVVAAIWLLDETKKRLKESYKVEDDVAEVVAVGAVKYSMLRLHPRSEIAFDIDESIRLDGDSGPYLQYTYARAKSVLRKSQKSKVKSQNYNSKFKIDELEQEELSLLRTFYKFPEVVETAATQYAPNLLCSFLYDLSSKYNLLYNNLSILGGGNGGQEIRNLRLALTQVTANILKTGLNLLGIQAPERM